LKPPLPDLPLSRAQVGLYRDLFVASHDGFDEQAENGDWKHRKGKLTFDRLVVGLKGTATLAISGIDRFKRSKWVALDLDTRDQASIVAMRTVLGEELGIKPGSVHIEDSGGKGYHLWMFLSKPTPLVDLLPLVSVVRSLAKDINVEVDRVFPMDFRRLKAPLGINQTTKRRTVFVRDDFSPFVDQGAYLDVIAASKIDVSKLILPPLPSNPAYRRVPECVKKLEHQDLKHKGKRHKVLYGLVYGWTCQGLSEGEILAASENWYKLHYKVEAGTRLPEHLRETKQVSEDFKHARAKFDCRNYPDVYNCTGAQCQQFNRTSITVQLNAVRPFDPTWGKLPSIALHVYLRMKGLEAIAKAAHPPHFKKLPVFYATEQTLCTDLCSPKTCRKAVEALAKEGLIKELPKSVLKTDLFKDYRRKNGHLKYGHKPPKYFVMPMPAALVG
jgi:hypothetical protein